MVDRYGIFVPQMTTDIFSTCPEHFPVLSSFMTYHPVCNWINTTGVTSGAGTTYPSGAPEFTPVFSGVRVTPSLVLNVCFVDRCLSLCTFSFGHCVVCSSIYGLWLLLWYLQTHKKTTQKTKTMSYTDPTLKTEMHSGAREGQGFLLLITHTSYYSYIQSSPIKVLAVMEKTKHPCKKYKILCHLGP